MKSGNRMYANILQTNGSALPLQHHLRRYVYTSRKHAGQLMDSSSLFSLSHTRSLIFSLIAFSSRWFEAATTSSRRSYL